MTTMFCFGSYPLVICFHTRFGATDMFNSIGNNLGVRKSKAGFSKIAYDQKHEMNNKTIKSSSGYIRLHR